MSESTGPGASYPQQRDHLHARMRDLVQAAPGPMQGFATLHQKAVATGVLDANTKELMALAISVASRCDGCIAFHTHDALRAGATDAEIFETLGVAVLMGGGPAAIYATHVLEAVRQFQERPATPA